MATRASKNPKTANLDESIQIALDAADASMDVTAEFERVSSQFSATAESTERLAKMSRFAMALSAGVTVLAMVVMGLVWHRSSLELERLTATNTELLTMLAENVSELENGISSAVLVSQKVEEANAVAVAMQAELASLTGAMAQIEDIQAQLIQLSNGYSQIETGEMATKRTEAQAAAIVDRLSTLNGEFAMNVSSALREALMEQTAEYRKVVGDLSQAVTEALPSGFDPSTISALQASIDSRLNGLNMRLNRITKTVSQDPKPPKQTSPAADVIKYP